VSVAGGTRILMLGDTAYSAMIAIAETDEFARTKNGRAILSFTICAHAARGTFRQMHRDVLRDRKAAASAGVALCPAIAKALSRLLMLFALHKQSMSFYCRTRWRRVYGRRRQREIRW
jgi:hypothetical protein